MNDAVSVKNPGTKPHVTNIILLVITGALAFLSLVMPKSFSQSAYPMQVGDVATEDILAPYSLTFESEVLTEKARQEAADRISPIYLPVDPSIGRRQVEALQAVLYYITLVRLDDYATQDEKLADIKAIEGLSLSDDSITRILQFSDSRWEAIESETANVLEQVMRNTLRDTDIFTEKRNVASVVDFSFPEEQADIVVDLVKSFIVPNSLYSIEETEDAIEEARQSIAPIIRSFVSGETLVSRGQIIREEDWEALQKYGLIQTSDNLQEMIGAAVFTILLTIVVGLYFKNASAKENYSSKALLLISITFLFFLSIARFVVFNRTILPYVYPVAAFGLTLSIVFNFELAGFLSLILGIMTAYGMPNGFDLTIYYIVPAIIGMLSLGNARRISAFIGTGLTIGIAGVAIIIAYRLPDSVTDWIGIATLSATSLINGLGAAAMTLLLQYLFSQILGKTTPLQLLDISRPDHPLLQLLLREAPGTYQHSLQVANLAEQAAEAIGADGLLVRVGAIFHDCGKSLNSQFFIENQVRDKIDSHNDLDPTISAQTIIKHITEGVELARKYHVPNRLIDFIREHHGTMYTQYQYAQAVQEAGDADKVDISNFTYPGPRPQSRETALLMLADGTEARVRAEMPKDEAELRALIDKVFNFIEKNGQLDDTNLTLRDLQKVKESFFHTLMGTYHPRVEYPTLEKTNPKPLTKSVEKTIKLSQK